MKTSYKKLTEIGTCVYVIDYWFDYDDAQSLNVKVFKTLESALTFIANLEQIGFTKYTFAKTYWLGYFDAEGKFIHTDKD